MLAITTQRFRVPLMWAVPDRAGSSNTEERIALLRRYLALFGSGSMQPLLADREFIDLEWLNFPEARGIPFAIRVKAGMIASTRGGRRLRLRSGLFFLQHSISMEIVMVLASVRFERSIQRSPDKRIFLQEGQL